MGNISEYNVSLLIVQILQLMGHDLESIVYFLEILSSENKWLYMKFELFQKLFISSVLEFS